MPYHTLLPHHRVTDSGSSLNPQDVLDLRAARWVSRRKAEGPKRIEDVHREAQAQLAAQNARDREERYGGPRCGLETARTGLCRGQVFFPLRLHLLATNGEGRCRLSHHGWGVGVWRVCVPGFSQDRAFVLAK